MEETNARAADAVVRLLDAYLSERVAPHPILGPYLGEAAGCATGAAAIGMWDERAPLEVRLILGDQAHSRLATELRSARLWQPARDFRLALPDREPFRRFREARVLILSASQLEQEFRFDLPATLWTYAHAALAADPVGTLESCLHSARERFDQRLPDLRCEHYYQFRRARSDLDLKLAPQAMLTLLTIKRGEAVREALRLAFLADGKPYPEDRWLESMAERETRCGSGIVTAVRAFIAAREPQPLEHAGKVLRDRVAFALQQGGVREQWLEQWWLWPGIASPD